PGCAPHNSLVPGKLLRETTPAGGTRRQGCSPWFNPQPGRSCMKKSHRRPFMAVLVLALFAVLVAAIAGCSKQSSLVTGPETSHSTSVAALKMGASELRAAFRAQEANTPGLMGVAGVVGTATTADDQGHPAIMVLTEYALGSGRLPATLDGYRVIEAITGKIVAYKG